MQKKIWTLMCLLLAAACSSSPKAENVGGESYEVPPPKVAGKNKKDNPPTHAETPVEEPKPMASTARTDAQALVEAVKSENDEAIAKAATGVLGKNPSDAKALNALGFYHYKKGHYSAALLLLGKAIKADPNASEAHNNLGLTYLAEKEDREAIKSFRRAVEVNSNDGVAAANLGSMYVRNGDYIKALVAMEIAYRKNSKDPKILNNYGIALAANKKFNEARDMYKQALNLNSGNKDVMLNYAILLIDGMNQPKEGLELLNKVRFLGPAPEMRNRLNSLENKAKASLK